MQARADCTKHCTALQAKKAPALLILKTYDEPVVPFEGAFEEAAIAAFVETKTAPLLVEMDQSPRNKKALNAIFSDQATPKLLAVVGEVGAALLCPVWAL